MPTLCVDLAPSGTVIGGAKNGPSTLTVTSNGTVLTIAPPGTCPYTLQPTDEIYTFEDGIEIGWGIATAWLATYAVMFLVRIIRTEMEARQNDPQP